MYIYMYTDNVCMYRARTLLVCRHMLARHPFDIESSFHVQHLQANTGTDEIALARNRDKMQRYVKKRNTLLR